MLGDDLAVLADGKVLFTVDDFASNEAALLDFKACRPATASSRPTTS